MRLIVVAALSLVVSACTWVKMEPGGAAVRVARADEDLSGCARRGEVAVSVKDQVGFYQRDELKVRDELEVMARNEAPRLSADTLQAVDEPLNGEQRFAAYNCRGTAPVAREAAPQPQRRSEGEAETFPIR